MAPAPPAPFPDASATSPTAASGAGGERPCPLCGEPLYAWILLPDEARQVSVGTPLERGEAGVVERCESCGVALAAAAEPDLEQEWRAIIGADSRGATDRGDGAKDGISIPNRASLQAALGVEGWAAIRFAPGTLMLTPRSLELLAERGGARIRKTRTPITWRAQGWMWQTLLNALTFHPNFARDVRAGRLRPASARSRLRFWLDALVTVLAAPLVVLVSAPLELIAALLGRGGELATELLPPG